MLHVTSTAKGHSMPVTLRKAYRSAYLYHTHTHVHMALCMYTCSCIPTTLSPSPLPPPSLAHSNLMPQCMYASVPRCMPIARLDLLHNTMPSHTRTPFSKSLVNVRVRVCACACKCMCVYVHVTKGELKACVCLHM